MKSFAICSLMALLLSGLNPMGAAETTRKPRLIVLTDIGGDPDDKQSMVRLLTYANEFQIEGLIASASGTPGQLKRDFVQPQLIQEFVEAYGKIRDNLEKHKPGYPTMQSLLSLIKSGNPNRGVPNLGANGDSEGSRWLISVVDRADTRPVNIAIWGGSNELAQVLWRVRQERSAAELQRFIGKLRVHSIGHQDDTGPWILQNFPTLFFVLSASDPDWVFGRPETGVNRRESVYRGMYFGGDESLTSLDWINTNVRTNHGPLGALYPSKTGTAPNPHGALKEGDTPSWFYFLPTGMSDPDHPEWGGWGGRFQRVRGSYYNDAQDQAGDKREARATIYRWRPAYQNDFEARMDWNVQSDRTRANHNPVAILNGDRTLRILSLKAVAGKSVALTAAGSSDPDGNTLTYRWFHYPEPSSAAVAINLEGAESPKAVFRAPQVTAPTEFHIILEVRDSGAPALSAFRRAIISVAPAK